MSYINELCGNKKLPLTIIGFSLKTNTLFPF